MLSKDYKIRDISINDKFDVFEIYNNSATLKYTDFEVHKTLSESEELIRWIAEGQKDGSHFFKAIEYSATKKLIGVIGVYHINLKHRFASINSILNHNYWGKNIITEAFKPIIANAFDVLKLNRLEGEVFENHTSSIRMLEKIKFRREGLQRQNFLIEGKYENSYIYSLLAEEYQVEKEYFIT